MAKAFFNRNLVLLTLVEFLVYMLLPFYAAYSPEQALARYGNAADNTQKVLICTENGFATISIADLQNGKAPKSHIGYQCALCYVSAHSITHTGFASAIVPYTPLVQHVYYYNAAQSQQPYSLASNNHLSRAPPVSFSA